MSARRCFPVPVVSAIRAGKILGIRAGTGTHRIIGIWAVVVEGRVFVRSWSLSPGGWYDTLIREKRGTIQIGSRRLPVRAVRTRSKRLKKAVSAAYRAKYETPGSVKYVRGLSRPKCRGTTTELVPLSPRRNRA
jgi:hypothetical protein